MHSFDGFIFDMDGTLWDAVPSYGEIWNRTIADMGLDLPPVGYDQLCGLMGKHLDVIYDALIARPDVQEAFIERLEENSRRLMPELGGVLYPGVRSTLQALKDRGARLFMVSNCEKHGLPNFLSFTDLQDLFTDHLSFGQTGADKDENIRTIIARHDLKAPIYVGDTMGDLAATHAAGIPFAWASYGFGKNVTGQDFTLNSISDLLTIQQ